MATQSNVHSIVETPNIAIDWSPREPIKSESFSVQVSKNTTALLDDNLLELHNEQLLEDIIRIRADITANRITEGYISAENYRINQLKGALLKIVCEALSMPDLEIEVISISRGDFWFDYCIKIPNLIKKIGFKKYVWEIIPWLKRTVETSHLATDGIIEGVESKGMYLNIRINDTFLMGLSSDILTLGDNFGKSDVFRDQNVIIDYPSPNTAKKLHIGHVRSGIIWQALHQIYKSTGYAVHGMNHINDLGWYGTMIHWYIKWKDILPEYDSWNDMLYAIYLMFRKGEDLYKKPEKFKELTQEQIEELRTYYGYFETQAEFADLFSTFAKEANTRHTNLEAGKPEEYGLWKQFVKYSLDDFDRLYRKLAVSPEYTVGESFFGKRWRDLVHSLCENGLALFYTKEAAEADIEELRQGLSESKIGEKEFATLSEEIKYDIGSYVIRLPGFRRYVVLKADGNTIYATRDLAALLFRINEFNPSKIVYIVGKEQSDHFNNLFASLKEVYPKLNTPEMSHLYFGLYVDEDTKKKLSSRDGTSDIMWLIEHVKKYFEKKYTDTNEFTPQEVEDISEKLAVGSIIFNDIRKDKRENVTVSHSPEKTAQKFEESGGAYVLYTLCRAKSVISKSNIDSVTMNAPEWKLEDIEVTLLKRMIDLPDILADAARMSAPEALAEYMFNLSNTFNSFYSTCPILKWNFPHRLIITKSFIQTMENVLRICNIQTLERI